MNKEMFFFLLKLSSNYHTNNDLATFVGLAEAAFHFLTQEIYAEWVCDRYFECTFYYS